MLRNFCESEIGQQAVITAETAFSTMSAVFGIWLAQLVAADIGRGDLPNAAFEAAGTILGVALAVISGRAALTNAENTPQTK